MIKRSTQNITREEVKEFIDSLFDITKRYEGIKVHFHNDMDGLNSALIFRYILNKLFPEMPKAFVSLDHTEKEKQNLTDGILHVFLDINNNGWEKDNVVIIDHHLPQPNMKMIDGRHFILSPPDGENISVVYPSCTALLAAYVHYIIKGGEDDFLTFLNKKPFRSEPFIKTLIHLAALSDNLWHLSDESSLLRSWVGDKREAKSLLLLSISASILLGEKERRVEVIKKLFSHKEDKAIFNSYVELMSDKLVEATRLSRLTELISDNAVKFIAEVLRDVNQQIPQSSKRLENVKERLNHLLKSKPARLRNYSTENWEEKRGQWEMLRDELKKRKKITIPEEERKRLRYYVEEILNLKRQEQIYLDALKTLMNRKRSIINELKEGNLPLLVYIPKQSSFQVKGVLASLMYYHGWKNIVMEERGSIGVWGSRGFEREKLKEILSTLTLDEDELKKYMGKEEIIRSLENLLKGFYNIERSITFTRYSGGLGGRGLTYGGEIKGYVPFLFALLEEGTSAEEKLKELMRHWELGPALKGLTEGESQVPVIKALKDKLKRRGFLLVQPLGFKQDADLLKGNFSHILMSFLDAKRTIEVNLGDIEIPELTIL